LKRGGKPVPTRTPGKTLRRIFATLTVAGFALAFVASVAPVAEAKKSKSTQNEAQWISFDAAAKTVTVKITKKGKGPNKKLLKARKEATFNVIPEGSVLTRTSVAINGVKGEITDIPEGKTVLIYWVPDEKKEGEFFARKIDVIFSEEELDEKYGKGE
jgi:hypothetical protein